MNIRTTHAEYTRLEQEHHRANVAINNFRQRHKPQSEGGRGFIQSVDSEDLARLIDTRDIAKAEKELAFYNLLLIARKLPEDEWKKMTLVRDKAWNRVGRTLLKPPVVRIDIETLLFIRLKALSVSKMEMIEACQNGLRDLYLSRANGHATNTPTEPGQLTNP